MPDDHAHAHDHAHGSELSEMEVRVRALETILTEKGYVDPAAFDQIVEAFETRIGPHIGARIVARAWSRSRIQAPASGRRDRGGQFVGKFGPGRQPSDRGREYAADPQHRRLHLVLLLSVVGAGAAAGLVQIGALPLARGDRSQGGPRRFRRDLAARDRDPHLGFDRRDAVSGAADAARGHRRLERGTARRTWSPATAWSAPACRSRPRKVAR